MLSISTSAAAGLSTRLRTGDTPELMLRRHIIGANFIAAASMGLIAMFQSGIIKRLPDVPLPYFDAEKVDSSNEAYQKLGVPDAFLGLVSFPVTALLAVAGPAYPARRERAVELLLRGKSALDFVQAARLSRDQWTKHRAFCIWCLLASGATAYGFSQAGRLAHATLPIRSRLRLSTTFLRK